MFVVGSLSVTDLKGVECKCNIVHVIAILLLFIMISIIMMKKFPDEKFCKNAVNRTHLTMMLIKKLLVTHAQQMPV